MSPVKVLVVGDAMLDLTRTTVIERRSPEAHKCPVVREVGRTWSLGGAANVARWLAADPRLDVTLMAPHGRDDASARLEGLCLEAGIRLSLKLFSPELAVTIKERLVVEDAQRGSAQHLVRVDADEVGQPDADAVTMIGRALELATKGPNVHRYDAIVAVDYDKFTFRGETGEQLLALLASSRLPTFVNSKRPERWRRLPVTFLICNHEEMVDGFADHNRKAVRERVEAAHLVVTQGAGGVASISRGGDPIHRLTLATEVVDVCGAGDAFTAGLVRQALRGGRTHLDVIQPVEMVDILDYGQRCAAFCCEQVGVGTPLVGEEVPHG